MNYITYEKDIAQSKSFYETFKACIQPKQCYDNIKRIIFDTKSHPYQIAFGYMSSGTVDNLYFRHAFFLSPERERLLIQQFRKKRKITMYLRQSTVPITLNTSFGRNAQI